MGLSHSYNKTNRTRHKIMIDLAYDIIKAHGGIIKVESKEGIGSEFIVELPT